MHHHYRDITDKLGTPIWWDEYAVPRYCDFSPEEVAYIYARQVAFVHIKCQGCGHSFMVAMSSGQQQLLEHEPPPLMKAIEEGTLHYGDPPNNGCCGAGPTMNCYDIKVVEFWEAVEVGDWKRNAKFEVGLDDEDC